MRLLGFEISRAERREAYAQAERRDGELEMVAVSNRTGMLDLLGLNSTAGPIVNAKTALGIPAYWCAVNVLADLIASVPLQEFAKAADGSRERVTTGMVAGMFAGTVNDDFLTSYKWRKGRMISALTTGAGRTYVERNAARQPVNLWPLDTSRTQVEVVDGRTLYHYRQRKGARVTYRADEVIDITFMDEAEGCGHVNPVKRLRDTLGLAIALERYASKFFQNGGIPPLALQAPAGSPGAVARGKADTAAAIKKANEAGDPVLYMPEGTRLEPIGFDPEKGQLVEAQRFVVEQICRVLNLPPSFVHDLTHGNFANTEQADLHLVKHTATAWVRQWETELNAKLYGPRNTARFAEFNLDGLLRGDFKTRMEGIARGVQSAVLKPNEGRRMLNLADEEGGNRLFIQGATVPIEMAGKIKPLPASPAEPEKETEQ